MFNHQYLSLQKPWKQGITGNISNLTLLYHLEHIGTAKKYTLLFKMWLSFLQHFFLPSHLPTIGQMLSLEPTFGVSYSQYT